MAGTPPVEIAPPTPDGGGGRTGGAREGEVIRTQQLTKVYAGTDFAAVDRLDLSVQAGEIFGLLGPNGAGKSSLMRTIATLQDPDTGSIFLDDIDVLKDKNAVRKVLGYLPQEFGVYPKMSALDMLHHLAIMKGISNKTERTQMVDALLNQTNLWESRKKALSTYSGGMKQRFGIAQALLANPKLIIVDEPTAGLDPISSGEIDELVLKLQKEHHMATIVVTHDMHSAKTIANRLAILDKGSVVIQGTFEELQQSDIGFVKEFLKLA